MATLPKGSVDSILSFDAEMFPDLGSVCQLAPTVRLVQVFTQEEKDDIKKKIRDYQAVKGSGNSVAGARTGGASLLTELQKVEYFKEGLLSHIQAIRDILKPKEVSRTALADKEKATQDHARRAVAGSFAKLEEKLLRGIAESVLGDRQLDYTKEELPLVLATQQITGALLEPGKVM